MISTGMSREAAEKGVKVVYPSAAVAPVSVSAMWSWGEKPIFSEQSTVNSKQLLRARGSKKESGNSPT